MLVTGVSASDVREIAQAEISRVVDELSSAAQETAAARIASLTKKVEAHFADKPETHKAFAEPDFQYLLSDAGRAAASNPEEHTERLLVDLLANRATEGNGARVKLATSQAVKAADKLSLEALNGLTGMWAIANLDWSGDEPSQKLENAERVAGQLLELPLPNDVSWISDVDVLNLVRLTTGSIFSRHSYGDIIRRKARRSLRPGIDTTASEALLKSLSDALPELMSHLRPHPLKDGFVLLPGNGRDDVLALTPSGTEATPELDQLIEQNGFDQEDPAAVERFNELLAEKPLASEVGSWWDAIPPATFTMIGDVVGFVNVCRLMSIDNASSVAELLAHRAGSLAGA